MRKRKHIRRIVIIVLIQVLIVYNFLLTIHQRRQATVENTNTTTFIVEQVEYIRVLKGGRKASICSESEKYQIVPRLMSFPDNFVFDDFKDKKITIRYQEKFVGFGVAKYAVEIFDEEHIYCSMQNYNKEQSTQLTWGIIALSIIELIWSLLVFFYYLVFIRNNRAKR